MKLEEVEVLRKDPPTHYNYINKVGNRYGKLVVVFYAGTSGVRNKHQFACLCDCGSYTLVSTLNLRDKGKTKSCGCSQNLWKTTIDPNLIQSRVKKVETDTDYIVEDYGTGKHDREKWTFRCKLHGAFKATFSNVAVKRTQCPCCADIFKGFNQMIPGYFYLNLIERDGTAVALKYGITNSTPEKRIEWISAGTDLKLSNIFSNRFILGANALDMERSFKKQFGGRYISKEEMSDGFTETVPIETLEKSLNWATEYLTSFSKSTI